MEHTPSPRSPLFFDQLTGIPTVLEWMLTLAGGIVPEPGGLIVCEIANLTRVDQAYGYAAGDRLLTEVLTRVQQALPERALTLRGTASHFVCWLPGMHGKLVEAFISHISRLACTRAVALTDARTVYPVLKLTSRSVDSATPLRVVLRALEQELRQQVGSAGLLSGRHEDLTAGEELEQRMHSLQLFGREPLIQQLLASLKLPARQPCLVTVVAPACADTAHLLAGVGLLLSGQQLPLAEVSCRPGDQAAPYALLTRSVYRFLDANLAANARQRVQTLCHTYPWVAGLFPELREGEPPPPAKDGRKLSAGQALLLLELSAHDPAHRARAQRTSGR